MLKRYVFFGFDNNIDALHYPNGGKNDVKYEADTMEELLSLVPFDKLNWWEEYHWLDLDERRWSTQEEEREFLTEVGRRAANPVVKLSSYWPYPEPRNRYIDRIGPPLMWFFNPQGWPKEPDNRTEAEKRADYLRSCHIKYTK